MKKIEFLPAEERKNPGDYRATFLLFLMKWAKKRLVAHLTLLHKLRHGKIGLVISDICSQCEEEDEIALRFICICLPFSEPRRRICAL